MQGRRCTAAWSLGLILAVSGPACTSSQRVDTSSGPRVTGETCFDARNVDSFSPLGWRFVYLRSTGGEQYLLTLDSVYTSLPFATGIAVSSAFGRVCSNTGAAITFTDSGRQVVCRIVRVESVAGKEAAQKLVEGRRPTKPKG